MTSANAIIRGIGGVVVKFFAVVSLSFVLLQSIPGGPAEYVRSQVVTTTSSEQVNIGALVDVYTNMNPNLPLHEQYLNYLGALLQGDLGRSIVSNEPVASILLDAAPWTIFFMSISIFAIFAIAIVLGSGLAYFEGTRLDAVVSTVAVILTSIPNYIAGIILVMIFSYQLGWFPSGGRMSAYVTPGFTLEFLANVLHHAALIIFAFIVTTFGFQTLLMRANSISVLGSDYVYVARLRGISPSRITTHYVARNAVLPLYTNFMIIIGFMFGGAVVLETIFSYAGMGYYLYQAIVTRDYSLAMGAFLLIASAVIVAIFVADLTYTLIDPRIGAEGE